MRSIRNALVSIALAELSAAADGRTRRNPGGNTSAPQTGAPVTQNAPAAVTVANVQETDHTPGGVTTICVDQEPVQPNIRGGLEPRKVALSAFAGLLIGSLAFYSHSIIAMLRL